ncbi:cyclomaltodextrinase [soil metagenome]
MNLRTGFVSSLFVSMLAPAVVFAQAPAVDKWYANRQDQARAPIMAEREADWRNGAIVYQVLVDRFAPSENLEAKRALYPAPKKLRAWNEKPTHGQLNEDVHVWSHEIDFWGGDLKSVEGKLDYLQGLGVNVVYLNPIHLAYTNHKYDAQDYFAVSPEFGTRDDVKALAEALHARGMRLVLDGVFNHMGRSSPWFQEAQKDPKSQYRDWYFIGPEYKLGYRAWYNVDNLPEVNLENLAVRKRLFLDSDSVVQGYLRDGVDGWRLDVAFDIGPAILDELTTAAHTAKPGSLVVGEIYNYPETWSPALDGGLNMTAAKQIFAFMNGELKGPVFGAQIDQMVADTGIESMLKWWLVLDNHDRKRLRTEAPERWKQQMAQALQFTLPGSPCIYYGVEIGMEGGEDPAQRGPFQWDLVKDDNEYYTWMKKLIALRNGHRGLRIGDFRKIETASTLAFLRRTDRAAETVLIVANASDKPAKEVLMVRESKLMDNSKMKDLLGDAEVSVSAGTVTCDVPAHTVWILAPVVEDTVEFSNYRRAY